MHEKGMKFWSYQLQFQSGVVEERIQTKNQIKEALNSCYGGVGPNGERGFVVEQGFGKYLPVHFPTFLDDTETSNLVRNVICTSFSPFQRGFPTTFVTKCAANTLQFA